MQRALRAVVVKDLADMRGQKRPLKPEYFEWSFGSGESPPLELEGDHAIRLRGKVDRIDVDHENKTFLIIDYKTGSGKITGKDIENGRALQLPLYIHAVQRLLLPGYLPVGGLYFSLATMSMSDGFLRLDRVEDYFDFSMRSSSFMPPEQWQAVMDGALKQVHELVADLYEGRFERSDQICAAYCAYQDMCRCGMS